MNAIGHKVATYPYVQKVHDDTLDLLVELRDFCALPRQRVTSNDAAYRNLLDAIQKMRITSRLELAMSWVLFAKAEEGNTGDAGSEFIKDLAAFVENDPLSKAELSPVMHGFHERSNRLIQRILHLDQSGALSSTASA